VAHQAMKSSSRSLSPDGITPLLSPVTDDHKAVPAHHSYHNALVVLEDMGNMSYVQGDIMLICIFKISVTHLRFNA
jgi:hypothetical protein